MKTNLSYSIRNLVEYALPRGSGAEKFFYVCVNAQVNLFAENEFKDKCERQYIHILFQRTHNYTKVFWHMTDKIKRLPDIKPDEWELKIDHDSCWYNCGLSSPLFKVECEMKDRINKNDWSKISDFHRLDLFNNPRLLTGRIEQVETGDSWNKKYNVYVSEQKNESHGKTG